MKVTGRPKVFERKWFAVQFRILNAQFSPCHATWRTHCVGMAIYMTVLRTTRRHSLTIYEIRFWLVSEANEWCEAPNFFIWAKGKHVYSYISVFSRLELVKDKACTQTLDIKGTWSFRLCHVCLRQVHVVIRVIFLQSDRLAIQFTMN